MGNESFNYQTMLQTANALLLSGKPADREKLVQLTAVHKQFVDMFDRVRENGNNYMAQRRSLFEQSQLQLLT